MITFGSFFGEALTDVNIGIGSADERGAITARVIDTCSAGCAPVVRSVVTVNEGAAGLIPISTVATVIASRIPSVTTYLVNVPPFFEQAVFSVAAVRFSVETPVRATGLVDIVVFGITFGYFGAVGLTVESVNVRVLAVVAMQ